MPTDYLERMKEFVSEKPENEFGRKVFLFSYYCHGMSFIDMALLDKEKNIKRLEDGYYIVYKRYKTRNNKKSKLIYVKHTPQIQQLISEMSDFCQPIGNYLLPLINRLKSDEKSLYEHTRCRLKRINKYLENLEQEFGLSDIHVTTYVSRHTMAMSLQNNAVSREIISQVMGHNNLETTNTYLDSFANKEINKAISVL